MHLAYVQRVRRLQNDHSALQRTETECRISRAGSALLVYTLGLGGTWHYLA